MQYVKNAIWVLVAMWLSLEVLIRIIELWDSGGFWRFFAWFTMVVGITLWVFGVGAALKAISLKKKNSQ